MTKRRIERLATERATLEFDEEHVFFVLDGVRIAKRRRKGRWIPLEPGYEVFEFDGGKRFEIEWNGVRVH